MYSNSYMANSLLTRYLNISKLLELTPNTNEYNYHRTIMSKEEIDVVKQIKKKHHILLKPLWHYARKRNVRQHQQSECVFCHWLLRIVYVCSHFRLVVWAKSTTLKKIWIKNLKILSEIFAQFFIYICLESELLFI